MKIKLGNNLIFYWENGHFVSDDYINQNQKSIKPKLLPLLNWFSEWKDFEDTTELLKEMNMSEKELSSIILHLLNEKILITDQSDSFFLEQHLKNWDDWGNSAKYYHFYTRTLSDAKFLRTTADVKRLQAKKSHQPDLYKNYSSSKKKIKLPQPIGDFKEVSFIEMLLNRQTIRTFDENLSISTEVLSTILYYVWGAIACWTDTKDGIGKALIKTSPSGGARHSIEVYPVIFNVDGLEPGIYHYSVKNHQLEQVQKGDFREKVVEMCGDQPHTGLPAVGFFYTSCIERTLWKYNFSRAYKTIMMDLGHLSQTLYLIASWLDLGSFFTAALRDEMVEKAISIDFTKEIVLGYSGIGKKTMKVKEAKEKGRYYRDDLSHKFNIELNSE